MALTKSHKYVWASVQVVCTLTFVALAGLLSFFTCKIEVTLLYKEFSNL